MAQPGRDHSDVQRDSLWVPPEADAERGVPIENQPAAEERPATGSSFVSWAIAGRRDLRTDRCDPKVPAPLQPAGLPTIFTRSPSPELAAKDIPGSTGPAQKATGMDPMLTLRSE
jgi:hypothetical protein